MGGGGVACSVGRSVFFVGFRREVSFGWCLSSFGVSWSGWSSWSALSLVGFRLVSVRGSGGVLGFVRFVR